MTTARNSPYDSSSKEEYGSELGDYNATKVFELLAESKSNKIKKKEPRDHNDEKQKNV
ncbi:hypothetical protein JOC85_000427 [Bacillus mesophilus]|uniref:Uncharacterized protein n=1 Tax=Bacillus mesophilus TaxID=1808955 RepID=A0A6M0Q5Y6_9BACI|nr:hypothetical protein [Bacillus mesophilus]MBM7659660.1 hypothetical protein [Bacillus mesophilus]NEY70528.1 hypothetical protein [Bacillus mesophilus]